VTVAPGAELPEFVMDDIDLPRIRALMQLMRDVNPVHDDAELAAERGLRGPVNQGPANLSYVLNMLLAWGGEEAFLERIDFRFTDIVTTGDTVTAHGAVTAVAPDAAGPEATCDVWLEREDGVKAVVGTARVRLGGESGP
jgi:acyl dehydratase